MTLVSETITPLPTHQIWEYVCPKNSFYSQLRPGHTACVSSVRVCPRTSWFLFLRRCEQITAATAAMQQRGTSREQQSRLFFPRDAHNLSENRRWKRSLVKHIDVISPLSTVSISPSVTDIKNINIIYNFSFSCLKIKALRQNACRQNLVNTNLFIVKHCHDLVVDSAVAARLHQCV